MPCERSKGARSAPPWRSSSAGRFHSGFALRGVYRSRIYQTMSNPKARGPRAEHPRLVGFSDRENKLVERAARKAKARTNVYIREAALYQAREELGVEHPPAGEA